MTVLPLPFAVLASAQMLVGLTSFAETLSAEAARKKYGGRLLDWKQVVDHVRAKWFAPKR